MIATIASIALLLVIGYFGALCALEVAWWLRDRVHAPRRETVNTHAQGRVIAR